MEVVGYITTVIVLLFVCVGAISLFGSFFQGRKKKQAKFIGTTIPETGEGLDISKRYDIVYSGGDYGSNIIEKLNGVRIVGYVGRYDEDSDSKMYMRRRWLVVEFADSRRAYLLPHTIASLQEAAPTSPV